MDYKELKALFTPPPPDALGSSRFVTSTSMRTTSMSLVIGSDIEYISFGT